MDELFQAGKDLNRDVLVSFMTETRVELKHLTIAVKELADAVHESVQRFEIDSQETRDSLGGLPALRNGHETLGKRIAEVESKAVKLEERTTALETLRTEMKTWIGSMSRHQKDHPVPQEEQEPPKRPIPQPGPGRAPTIDPDPPDPPPTPTTEPPDEG